MKAEVLNRLSKEWDQVKEIAVYGFGRVAARNIEKLCRDFDVKVIIDNNPKFKGKKYKNIPIYTLEEFKHHGYEYKIIVTTNANVYENIKISLKETGLREYKDFCRLEEFLTEWYWKNRDEVVLTQVFSSVTSRCTFNCKHCNMLMPYFNSCNHYDYTAGDILEDLDSFFDIVDYLASYFVIGGEPLLNKDLSSILESVYDKYGSKIGYMQIISNGSVIPDEELIRVIKKCNIHVRLSDYTRNIPYKKKLLKVQEVLSNNNIFYSMSVNESWLDLGLPGREPEITDDPALAQRHMLMCGPCHLLNEKKFYYCGTIYSAEKCGFGSLVESDYVDFQKMSGTIEDKERILRYSLGRVDGDYIHLCNSCYGKGYDNKRIIEVAEQMPKN